MRASINVKYRAASLVAVGQDVESHARYLSHVVVSLGRRQAGHDHVAVVDTVDLVHLVLVHAVVEYFVVGVQGRDHLQRRML